jgi:hypothetical protein
MDGGRPDTLSDAQLDRELEAALGVEPSPEFLARVRTRVAREPLTVESGFSRIVESGFSRIGESGFSRIGESGFSRIGESGFSRIPQLAFEPMWAVATVGIVLAIVVPQVMRDESAPVRVRSVAASAADTAHLSEAVVDIGAQAQPVLRNSASRRAPAAPPEWGRTLPLQLSPVLFAEDDQRVFAMFMEAVGAGRLPEEAVHRPVEEPGEMEGLSIEPLVIAPLPSLARTAREGEDQWE